MLILIAGLPGSGKTSLAEAIAAKLSAIHFNSDQVRRELGLWGHYQPADKAAVYNELLSRTRKALEAGATVVVDSTFYLASLRKSFQLVAEQLGQKTFWVLATASDEVLAQRVSKPRPGSEAGLGIMLKIKNAFEPMEPPCMTIDTSNGNAETLAAAIIEHIQYGQKAGIGHP
jgi:predicted kinase